MKKEALVKHHEYFKSWQLCVKGMSREQRKEAIYIFSKVHHGEAVVAMKGDKVVNMGPEVTIIRRLCRRDLSGGATLAGQDSLCSITSPEHLLGV